METHALTVGLELAMKVADRLQAGSILAYNHPYYCGIGLYCAEGAFVHIQVGDWSYPSLSEALKLQSERSSECMVFRDRDQFVMWLAAQTDASLSGRHLADRWHHDNQRITIWRLEQFALDQHE